MTKFLNILSLIALSMSWQHMASAAQTQSASSSGSMRCMSVMGGYVPVPNQPNTYMSKAVDCGEPVPAGFTQQLPAGAIVVANRTQSSAPVVTSQQPSFGNRMPLPHYMPIQEGQRPGAR